MNGHHPEPPKPLIVDVSGAMNVRTHYWVHYYNNKTLVTTDWEQVQGFLNQYPKAVVTVQHEVWTTPEMVTTFTNEGE